MELKTVIRRPQDCSKALTERFIATVLSGGETNEKTLRFGIPYTEVLLFTGTDNDLMGVSALKFPRQTFLEHLYSEAGVSKMYNPFSIESCWLSVLPKYRGQGVWQSLRTTRMQYLANRPCHSVKRVSNPYVNNMSKDTYYQQAGKDFYSDILDETVKLMVANHDEEFDPKKQFLYLDPNAKNQQNGTQTE